MAELKSYHVWDAPTRWFHWINVLCVLVLIGIGLVIFNAKALDISNDGKILLKTLHVYTGYIFALNLAFRLIWAFVGNQHARWTAMLPFGRSYWSSVRNYVSGFLAGRPVPYLGHNPLGRLSVVILLLLLTNQAITGLVLAGTDIFYPPLGPWISGWIAANGVDPATLVPYAKEMYDPQAYEQMRAFRKPFITLHEYGFFALAGMIVLHIVAVVITELREGGGLISAMFTGRKIIPGRPVDSLDNNRPD